MDMTCPTPAHDERSAPASPPPPFVDQGQERGEDSDWPLVVTGGPWPERIGHRARPVPADGRTHYPWDKPKCGEIILLVEDDPLSQPHEGWTCVMSVSEVSVSPTPKSEGRDE